jgi:hypothetical protein
MAADGHMTSEREEVDAFQIPRDAGWRESASQKIKGPDTLPATEPRDTELLPMMAPTRPEMTNSGAACDEVTYGSVMPDPLINKLVCSVTVRVLLTDAYGVLCAIPVSVKPTLITLIA